MNRPRRIALLPGTSPEDPTYERLFAGLSRSLRPLGATARTFCPRREGAALGRYSPDIVHLHFTGHLPAFTHLVLSRALRRGARLALTFQDLDNPDRPPRSAAQTRAISEIVGRAVLVTALTPSMARKVASAFPQARGKIYPIGNGVGPEWFQPRSHGPSQDIISTARLSPYKGTDILLWAFRELLDEAPHARLSLFGEDFQSGHFQGLAKKLGLSGSVRFQGRASAPRLKAALSGCRFFVSASRDETYGMALLEALAGSVPVLASRTGAARLLLKHHENAWLAHPGDWRSLARGLKALWRDKSLRRTLGQAGRETARGQLWDFRARDYARLYDAIP